MGEEVKLYGNWASPFSCRVDIALKLKGVEYRYYEEDLKNKSASLLEYNPIHKKVPAFVHNEKPLAESLVILEYIEETWKTNPIFPQDLYERAQARFWTRFIDDKIVPTLREAWVKEDREKEAKEASEYLEFLEKELKGKYFGGESIGVVDIAGNVIAQWLPIFQQLMGIEIMTETKFPKLCKWSHDFATHPVIKEASPSKEDLIAFYKPQLSTSKAPTQK
ncbi:probable glutathione S-transferase [Humulus lupulus]|uniref:probable glutathione S-transferase n=1 Tax=Humulus lupulus TaxID=3486 RepID=UPI002B40B9D4|nr:probable glutathione S-transferase [Humulus lupulus]